MTLIAVFLNSKTDRAAKEALEKEPLDGIMLFVYLKPLTAKYIHQVWQKEWDEAIIVSNKLHDILPKLSDELLTFCNTRKEDTVLNRLQIGHSCFTHSFLFKNEEPPVCVPCNAASTVKHIVIECAELVEVRKKYFEERSLYSLFRNVNLEKFFDYLKEIGMFYKV